MPADSVTQKRISWRLSAQEAAHAMPVLQSVHTGLRALPAPRLATIRRLAQRHDIRDGTLRTALSRACAAGSLSVADGRYRLGPLSVEQAAAARALLARQPGYTLAVVLEGEDSDLPRLHEIFARTGFRQLQRSLWVGARTADDRLGAALHSAGLSGVVIVFHTNDVDADAGKRLANLWRLKERTAELHSFHRQLFNYLAPRKITPIEAAWRCVEAAPIWYRIAVQDEPPFPRNLCGPDYPLDVLNAAWRAHLASMTENLRALWRQDEA